MCSYLSENLQFFKGNNLQYYTQTVKHFTNYHVLEALYYLEFFLYLSNHEGFSLQRHILMRQSASSGMSKDLLYFPKHSCRQRLHSFWSAPRIISSGQV